MDKHWISRLWADSAFPLIVLAVALSQLNNGQHENRALHQPGWRSSEAQAHDGIQQSAGKHGTRAATEPTPVEERTPSDKGLVHVN